MTLNDLIQEVFKEADRRKATADNFNPKLFATTFFLLGLGLGDLKNHHLFGMALENLTEIENQEKIKKPTGEERMKSRLDFLETMSMF